MMILSHGLRVLLALLPTRTIYSSFTCSSLGSSSKTIIMAGSKRAAAGAAAAAAAGVGKPMRQSALNFSGVPPAKKKAKQAAADTGTGNVHVHVHVDGNGDPSPPAPAPAPAPPLSLPPYRIFCDLDGVLTDFDAGVVKLCGKPPSQISPGLLWSSIAKAGPSFFEDLAWCSDGLELWNAILPYHPTILTGVSRAAVAREKAVWCKRELCVETNHVDMAAKKKAHEPVTGCFRKKQGAGGGVTNVITCWSKNKHRESGPRRVLIDDRKDLRDAWVAAGGIFILHTDTVSSLRQLREQGIILPKPPHHHHHPSDDDDDDTTKPAAEQSKGKYTDTEADVAAAAATSMTSTTTTEADDETSKVARKETTRQEIAKPHQSAETSKEEEPSGTVTPSAAVATTGEDDETGKVVPGEETDSGNSQAHDPKMKAPKTE